MQTSICNTIAFIKSKFTDHYYAKHAFSRGFEIKGARCIFLKFLTYMF